MSSDTHRTDGEQFAATGHSSPFYYSQQQPPPNPRYRDFDTRPVFDPHRNTGSTTQQSAGQSQPFAMKLSELGSSGDGALGILAEVALAGGGISDSSTARPNMPQPTGYAPEGVSTGLHMNTYPPVSQSAGLRPPPPSDSAVQFTRGEYSQNKPFEHTAAYSWTASTSYDPTPSIFEAAAGLRSFAMSASPSIRPPCVNNETPASSDSRTPSSSSSSSFSSSSSSSSSSTTAKKKSSYIVEQMEKVDKVEKDSVGRVRDRTNYFASYSNGPDPDYSVGDSEKDDTLDNGTETSAAKSEQESTRDWPGDKYVKLFQEPGQQRYEDAILEILDGMELPR
ncbi:hypothetical protein PISL3812_05180 [Talaromyces islandicus]|uniref:Uncharacterized protein n=1 Tax=Talaromyces islandicus TaxID=28573 RepID=A0A0U1LXR9_TALIS|nr:hypothetical protein PISL3812_05180 [Talaromyces islandicus]